MVEYHVSYPYEYNNITEMSGDSDLIINGYVTESKIIGDINGHELLFTDYTIKVTDVYKGKLSVNEIVVKQTGANVYGLKRQIQEDPLMTKDVTMILFLKEYEKNKYFIIGGPQGRFEIHDDKIYSLGEIHASVEIMTKHLVTQGISIEELELIIK